MKKHYFALFLALLIPAACAEEGSDPILRTVTGTVSVLTNVKIGAFSSDYWFLNSYTGEEDEVDHEFGVATVSFAPLVIVVPEAGGEYSIDLPADPTDMGELIAWVDTNTDSKFDLGTEPGYFPVKQIGGAGRTITGFSCINLGDTTYYLVSYSDGVVSHNDGFDVVGTGGFNFTID
jgi:hypothetical protein